MSDLPTDADVDAASFIRRHAGEHEPDLTPAQRDLLGRVIARRIERGIKLGLIARAAATALPELDAARARRLGRDETLRAYAWETLAHLRAGGATNIAISPARDACPACRAAGASYAAGAVPELPIAGCAQVGGCRCRYVAAGDAAASHVPTNPPSIASASTVETEPAEAEAPARPWYRPRAPRPHGPRWTNEERAAHRRAPRPQRPDRG